MEPLLQVEAVQEFLSNALIGRRIDYYQSVGSTMDVARQAVEEGAEEGTVILAEEQTAGRGRFGRKWVTAPGQNLSFSVVLYPGKWAVSRLSVAAAVAVARVLRHMYGLSPGIKWPNDVRVNGKKVCGILVEAAIQNEQVRYAVLGVGVNVNMDPSDEGDKGLGDTTCLSKEVEHAVQREEVLQAVLQELGYIYASLQEWGSVWREWRESMETLGKEVRVLWGEQVEEGVAEDVDGEGNLVLRRKDGTVVSLTAGEVTFQI